MNSIYIGDRPLDPPEDDDLDEQEACEYCEGNGSTNPTWSDPLGDQCPECLGSGFKDTIGSLADPGEPNDPPDEG